MMIGGGGMVVVWEWLQQGSPVISENDLVSGLHFCGLSTYKASHLWPWGRTPQSG